MGTFDLLMNGFAHALTPQNLLFAAFGVLLGTAIGVLPGIGPAMAVALLLPVTYAFDPTGAFIMFAGIYFGAMFGGSTTSILLNTPGESASVMAAIEGNPMAKSGRGAQALATAAIGHFIGGIVGVTGLVLVAPLIASVAVDIGAPDYFAIMVLAFVAVSAVIRAPRASGRTRGTDHRARSGSPHGGWGRIGSWGSTPPARSPRRCWPTSARSCGSAPSGRRSRPAPPPRTTGTTGTC